MPDGEISGTRRKISENFNPSPGGFRFSRA